ncbi:hypothetical protein ACLX1H_001034 [Fusarium chlamydosporum]
MSAIRRIVLHTILYCLLTLGLAKDDEDYDPASNYRPRNVTGLGDFYGWVGSYYNATAEVELTVAYQSLIPLNETCSELKNYTSIVKYDAILSVLERGPWNAGNNSFIFWMTLMPQTSSPFNVSSLPTNFMEESSNRSYPILSTDPTPNGYWRPRENAGPAKFNFTTDQVSDGAYNISSTLRYDESDSASYWGNVTLPTCNTTKLIGDYSLLMMDMRSWDVEDWDGFQYPEVSMQFDDKTANLTVDGAFHATPFLRANATEMEPPVRGGPAVIGYMSVRFSGVLDEYHSDTLSLNGSTPSWVRTVGFGNDSSNIGPARPPLSSLSDVEINTEEKITHTAATATQTAAPSMITQPPSLVDRAVTSFHTIVSTRYPQNRWSIGYGKIEGKDGFYTAACVDGLFAVSGIWAGCGDIIFTRCVGPSAFARSTTVSCIGTCLTHKIFDYDDATSSTRFIACNFPGTYDGSMTLLKTPIGDAAEPTSDGTSTATNTAETTTTSTTDSAAGAVDAELTLLAMGELPFRSTLGTRDD